MAHIFSMNYTSSPIVKPVLTVTFLAEEEHTSQQLRTCLKSIEEALRDAWNLPEPKTAPKAAAPEPKADQEPAATRAAPKEVPKEPAKAPATASRKK